MKRYFTVAMFVSLLLLGCQNDHSEGVDSGNTKGVLSLTPTRAGEATDDPADNFANGAECRLAVYDAGTTDPYQEDAFGTFYSVAKIKKNGEAWDFYFGGGSSAPQFGYIIDAENPSSIDMVGVYPYITNADLEAFPFTTADYAKSYMWAKTSNVELSGRTTEVPLDFQYVMSAFCFRFRAERYTNCLDFSAVQIELLDGEGNIINDVLFNGGTINFHTGEVTPTAKVELVELASSQRFSWSVPPEGGDVTRLWLDKTLYIPSFDMKEGDQLRISFKFDGVYIADKITVPADKFSAKEDGSGYEMKTGSRYCLDIKLDNYVKFSGDILIEDEWTEEEPTQTEI